MRHCAIFRVWPELNATGSLKENAMEPLIKAKELAKNLSVNVETVRRWTRAGIIPHVVVGQSKRYSLHKVMVALDSGSQR